MILDPSTFIGSALEGVIGAPILIGLPSNIAPIPNFVIGIIPEENAQGSVTLSGLQISGGDLFMKSAINGSEKILTMALSNDTLMPQQWIQTVANVLQILSGVGNAIGGGGIPNISGVSNNFVTSQLSSLRNIKNGNQPIMLLNSFVTLQSIGQNNNNLSSNWYIENYQIIKEEAEGGCLVQIKIKELLSKRETLLSAGNFITNFANEIISPSLGSSIGSLL